MKKILFVCTGNICRSPTAEGVLRHHVRKAGLTHILGLDSAGTHGYHVGEAPDPRTVSTALSRGFEIDDLRARKLIAADYNDFDLILACDNTHLRQIRELAPKQARAETALFLEYAGATKETEVPDPYYGNQRDFEYVLDLIEAAALPLIKKLHTGL